MQSLVRRAHLGKSLIQTTKSVFKFGRLSTSKETRNSRKPKQKGAVKLVPVHLVQFLAVELQLVSSQLLRYLHSSAYPDETTFAADQGRGANKWSCSGERHWQRPAAGETASFRLGAIGILLAFSRTAINQRPYHSERWLDLTNCGMLHLSN